MLLDEARIQGTLDHPNVVSVVDAIAHAGELFLVLGLVEGISLADLVRRMREREEVMPAAVAVSILTDVLEGLSAAHALVGVDGATLGVVHRDVSPHNVLIGADGVARVCDFGVAKTARRAQVTRTGQLKGKPSYMAPEQLDGRPLDARADVFAAALVLVELLTAQRCCAEAEPAAARRWMDRELADARAWLASLRIDGPLAGALARCLALDVDARPGSAREAAALLCEAQPPATAAEVASFVLAIADDLLAEPHAAARRLRAAAASHVETAVTEPAGAASRGRPDASGASSPASRRVVFGAALGVATLFAAAGFVFGRATTALPTAPIASEPAPLTARTAALPVKTSIEPAPALGPPRASADPIRLPTPPITVAVQQATLPPRARPKASASPAQSVLRSPRTAACEPPFVVDQTGVRVFKPECL